MPTYLEPTGQVLQQRTDFNLKIIKASHWSVKSWQESVTKLWVHAGDLHNFPSFVGDLVQCSWPVWHNLLSMSTCIKSFCHAGSRQQCWYFSTWSADFYYLFREWDSWLHFYDEKLQRTAKFSRNWQVCNLCTHTYTYLHRCRTGVGRMHFKLLLLETFNCIDHCQFKKVKPTWNLGPCRTPVTCLQSRLQTLKKV